MQQKNKLPMHIDCPAGRIRFSIPSKNDWEIYLRKEYEGICNTYEEYLDYINEKYEVGNATNN